MKIPITSGLSPPGKKPTRGSRWCDSNQIHARHVNGSLRAINRESLNSNKRLAREAFSCGAANGSAASYRAKLGNLSMGSVSMKRQLTAAQAIVSFLGTHYSSGHGIEHEL